MVVVVLVVLMVIIGMVIIGFVVGQTRDHDLTVRRLQSVAAIYAAEAGMNMAIRELMVAADEDGDGVVGTISDDGNDATDPVLGTARFSVTSAAATPVPGQTTLTSEGRSGEAKRRIQAVVRDS